jgi:hypothetical protein
MELHSDVQWIFEKGYYPLNVLSGLPQPEALMYSPCVMRLFSLP